MNSERRIYSLKLTVNRRNIDRVIVDPHYELKHAGYLNDEVILELVKGLDGREFNVAGIDGNYSYYATDDLEIVGKRFKLIWMLEAGDTYIGVIAAYRRK